MEVIDLLARVPQTGDRDDGTADRQSGADRKLEECNAVCGDVLAEVARPDLVSDRGEVIEQLSVDQMDLSHVRLVRVCPHPAAVLHCCPAMRIPRNPDALEQFDLGDGRLAEAVLGTAVDSEDLRMHAAILSGAVCRLIGTLWGSEQADEVQKGMLWAADLRQHGGMATLRDLVIDCNAPARLARFWGAVLDDYEVAPYDDEAMADLARHGITDPEDDPSVMLEPIAGTGPRIFCNLVPEAKTTKNRLHLDVAAQDPVAERDRLVALGAVVLRRDEDGWVVMADPEGNEFCLMD